MVTVIPTVVGTFGISPPPKKKTGKRDSWGVEIRGRIESTSILKSTQVLRRILETCRCWERINKQKKKILIELKKLLNLQKHLRSLTGKRDDASGSDQRFDNTIANWCLGATHTSLDEALVSPFHPVTDLSLVNSMPKYKRLRNGTTN